MGLANALFLAGFLAVAIPILIHMTRNRKYKHITIGTLRFLDSVVRESRRVRKIENWPLLLARIGIVALLALLFTRPFLREKDDDDGTRAETLVLLDASGSLAGPGAEGVRDAVRQIEKDLPPESTLTLVAFSDSTKVLKSMDEYEPRPGAPTDYVQAVDWTIERLQTTEQASSKVVLVSDLQQASLPSAPLRLWPGSARVEVVQVKAPGEWNACIERVDLVTPYLAEEIAVEARVTIFGAPKNPPTTATLKVDGGEEVTVDLPSPTGGRVTFRWAPGEQTEFRGKVELESDDAWPVDNSRPFLLRLKKRKRVLLIDGDPAATPFLGEAYFLAKALNASGASHGQSPFRAELRLDLSDKTGVLDLTGWDTIVCCNVKDFTGPEARALAQASAAGAGLLFALGEKSDPTGHIPLRNAGLFPKGFARTESPVPRLVATWDLSHPSLERFELADLRRLLLRDSFLFDPEDNWQLLARFQNENPVFLARQGAGGPLLVFANPLNREWNELAINRLYVPLMREWAAYLSGLTGIESSIRTLHPGLEEGRSPGVFSEQPERIDIVAAQPLEMDPATVDPESFRAALAIPDPAPQAPVDPPGVPTERERPNEWWPWIVLLLIALLILENYMSDRAIGTPTKSPAPATP